MNPEPEPCKDDGGDDLDWCKAYLMRKLDRLRKDPAANHWKIISAKNALAHLRGQPWPDHPKEPS